MAAIESIRARISEGLVIPAAPLALNSQRRLDERHQRALFRYYRAAGAGGLAVGVHTTQFAIRDAKVGLFQPVLQLAADEFSKADRGRPDGEGAFVRVAGICGPTAQAVAEAVLIQDLGFDAGLVSLGALQNAGEGELIDHCRTLAEILPLIGFYLQPAAGGRVLPYSFWRRFVEIEQVVAIKIAPFNRYQSLDVVRATVDAGRDDIALYTGNDDNIVLDLLTPFRFVVSRKTVERRIVGGLLGHWAVWTKRAVELHAECRRIAAGGDPIPPALLARGIQITDANAALFDSANGFAGCIPGLHEILHRQKLLGNTRCLDPGEILSPGQGQEIDRVIRHYPQLHDDEFVAQHLHEWLA